MAINFSFQGYVRGADVTKATDGEGKVVDVSQMPEAELARKLNNGELMISLGDFLYSNHSDSEIEIVDFEPD